MTSERHAIDAALNRFRSKARKALEEIYKAGRRAASLTSQLLAFSRKQVIQPVSLNLDAIAVATGKMLRRLIGEDIERRSSTYALSRCRRVSISPRRFALVTLTRQVV